MRIQSLVIDKLTIAIEDNDRTPTIETDYANRGYIMAVDDNLDVEWAIHFDFQTTYFSLKLYKGQAPYRLSLPLAVASTINGKSNSETISLILDGMDKLIMEIAA